jgi:hypothetical protein
VKGTGHDSRRVTIICSGPFLLAICIGVPVQLAHPARIKIEDDTRHGRDRIDSFLLRCMMSALCR